MFCEIKVTESLFLPETATHDRGVSSGSIIFHRSSFSCAVRCEADGFVSAFARTHTVSWIQWPHSRGCFKKWIKISKLSAGEHLHSQPQITSGLLNASENAIDSVCTPNYELGRPHPPLTCSVCARKTICSLPPNKVTRTPRVQSRKQRLARCVCVWVFVYVWLCSVAGGRILCVCAFWLSFVSGGESWDAQENVFYVLFHGTSNCTYDYLFEFIRY